MGYAILRTQKLKSGQAVRRSLAHAFREQDTPNADPSRTPQNTHIGAANVGEALARFNARLETQEKIRKNAVLAVEYLITGSPEDIHGKSREQQDAYFRDSLEWLKQRHGAENVIYAGIHRDEQTPHMYAYVVPLDERGKLNCRAFLGGAKALSDLQTQFATEVGQHHGLRRGIEGSKARHVRVKDYYARVNAAYAPLPEVKTQDPGKAPDEPQKPGFFASKAVKEDYRYRHTRWESEYKSWEARRKQRQSEIKQQRDAAVEVARTLADQAGEGKFLKSQVADLKKSNGKLAANNRYLQGVASLFSYEEIEARREQKAKAKAELEAERRQAQRDRSASVTLDFPSKSTPTPPKISPKGPGF